MQKQLIKYKYKIYKKKYLNLKSILGGSDSDFDFGSDIDEVDIKDDDIRYKPEISEIPLGKSHKLYLGNFMASISTSTMDHCQIDYILNASDINLDKDYPHRVKDFLRLNLRDDDTENILTQLKLTNQWIGNHLKSGNVLVNCHAGERRSVALILAFLMKLGYSLQESLEIVTKSKNSEGLQMRFNNPSFLQQLELYQEMGKQLDITNPKYKQFLSNFAKKTRSQANSRSVFTDEFWTSQ